MDISTSEALFSRAVRVIPGGVNSPVRSFGSVGGTPRFLVRGEGATVVDADGNRYVDLVQSWGPLPLGHVRDEVVAAARAALERGATFGAPTAGEVELAESIRDAVPSIEQVRLVSSGTEAAMSAIRLARGATGRSRILKFAGHYHGHSDALLVEAGSGVATVEQLRSRPHASIEQLRSRPHASVEQLRSRPHASIGIPGSPGVTAGAVADTVTVPWNDRDAVSAAVSEHGDDLAAILCEPVAANMNLVPPTDGFLAFLRDEADRSGALLVFDEVITGFRLGRAGAQGREGVTPDLTVLGKAIGGGFPLAAFGGREEHMRHLAPVGAVYQAGTLSGNPVAVAAGRAQLELLTDAVFADLERITTALVEGLREAFADAGVEARVRQHGTLAGILFTAEDPVDHEQVRRADHDRYARFFHAMLDRGVALAPSGHEVLFTSTALDDAAIATVTRAAREAAAGLG